MAWIEEELDLAQINALARGMVKHMGIVFTAVDDEGLTASMPVEESSHQPFGILHGGATATLAETVGSFASYALVHKQGKHTVGMEVTAQHLRSVKAGHIHAKALPVHVGRKVHVWDIRVKDDAERLIALCKLTVMVIDADGQ